MSTKTLLEVEKSVKFCGMGEEGSFVARARSGRMGTGAGHWYGVTEGQSRASAGPQGAG